MPALPASDVAFSPALTGQGLASAPCSAIRVVETGHVFRGVKPCPYCGGKLSFSTSEWQQEDDGSWVATEVQIECSNEPDIDSDEWWEWSHNHGDQDYNDAWYSLTGRVLRELRTRVRFNLPNVEVTNKGSENEH